MWNVNNTLAIEDYVFGFDVAVDDHFLVKVFKCHEDGGDHEFGLSFCEFGHFGEVVT